MHVHRKKSKQADLTLVHTRDSNPGSRSRTVTDQAAVCYKLCVRTGSNFLLLMLLVCRKSSLQIDILYEGFEKNECFAQ